jgi:hypothetical protein
VDFNENFLRQIICIVMVDHHFPHMPVHPLLIGANEHVEAVIPGIRIFNL